MEGRSGPTRRAVLRAAVPLSAVAMTAGCGGSGGHAGPPPPTPDELLRARVADEKQALIARYDAAIAAFPVLAGRLGPLRAEHAAHLAALRTATASPSPSRTTHPATASPTPTPTVHPATVAAAIADLSANERAASGTRLTEVLKASDGELARLLASIRGCEAGHVVMLAGG